MTTPTVSPSLFVSGVSYRSAPVEVRERLALKAPEVRDVLADLRQTSDAGEVMLLSTCNRFELWGAARSPDSATAIVLDLLCRIRDIDAGLVAPHVYRKTGSDAVQHCFRVAGSLDSMILGEPQILGQVKDAFDLAQQCESLGPLMHRLMRQTLSVAKRVRTETELGRHAVSVSSAAVELAKKIFGGLPGHGALLIGAGEMGELAAKHLVDEGVRPFFVANRTRAKAEDLAARLGGIAVAFDEWREALGLVDIVVTSATVNEPIVRASDVREARARRSRPLFFIDIAMPRNVDASVNDLDGVYCYDIDDLAQVVDANARERQREARKAEALVETEVAKFVQGLRTLDAVPTIVSLRERLDEMRRDEVARALARIPDASAETRAAIEAMSQSLVNKILHAPTSKLQESSRRGDATNLGALVRELFGIDRADVERGRKPEPQSAARVRLEVGWTKQPTS